MTDDYTLLSPENVSLRFQVAGVGSRTVAALIDYLIIGVGYAVLTTGVLLLMGFSSASSDSLSSIVSFAIVAVLILASFFLWFGYFVLFELLWNGQSIGKRRLGLRVIRADGQPASVTASLARNVVRIVDLFMFVGLLVMVIDRRSRRLGDFVAGTLVIREPGGGRLESSLESLMNDSIPPADSTLVNAIPNAERLTIAHYSLIRDYFARRAHLPKHSADVLAGQLSAELARGLSLPATSIGEPVAFLAVVAHAYEERHRYESS